tara:strand:- start:277 stop:984 length:708 start_codon:yes stop_codon:yes gene_type:complete
MVGNIFLKTVRQMSLVIFSSDDKPFLVGKYHVMYRTIDVNLDDPDTTFILHSDRFGSKDAEEWLPYIGNRLVVITDKKPKKNKRIEDSLIIHDSLKGGQPDELLNSVTAILTWKDRRAVWEKIRGWLPIPYAVAFLRVNVSDIGFWRTFNKANMEMNDDIVRAVMAFGITPKRIRIKWPKKKKKEELAPFPFRPSDYHWCNIVQTFIPAANEVRNKSDVIPSGIRKTKERALEWL